MHRHAWTGGSTVQHGGATEDVCIDMCIDMCTDMCIDICWARATHHWKALVEAGQKEYQHVYTGGARRAVGDARYRDPCCAVSAARFRCLCSVYRCGPCCQVATQCNMLTGGSAVQHVARWQRSTTCCQVAAQYNMLPGGNAVQHGCADGGEAVRWHQRQRQAQQLLDRHGSPYRLCIGHRQRHV